MKNVISWTRFALTATVTVAVAMPAAVAGRAETSGVGQRSAEIAGASRVGESSWWDFDGDGYQDLAIGAPYEDVAGQLDAGVIWVLYGGVTGLSGRNQLLYQDSPNVAGAAEASDHFGFSLAAGDFDNDGYGDLAVGVPGEDIDGRLDTGAVNIFHGSSTGLSASPDQDLIDPEEANPSPTPVDDGTQAGFALATLDWAFGSSSAFDGAELAIGMPGHRGVGGVLVMGGGQLYRNETGGASCICTWGDPTPDARQGSALVAGNFDSDSDDEFLVGGPREDVRTGSGGLIATDAGAVWVVDREPGTNAHTITLLRPGRELPGTAEQLDLFGTTLAAGDINGDGLDDAAIGVPLEDIGGVQNVGAVLVLRAAANGSGLLAGSATTLTLDSAGMPGSARAEDRLGQALAIADFGGPFVDDIAIGMHGYDVGGAEDAGAVFIRYSGLPPSSTQRWHQNVDGVADTAQGGDLFGVSLFGADFDDDGDDDLAIGVPLEDLSGSTDAGAIHVLRATSNGLTAIGDQFWHQDADGISGIAEDGDRFGRVFP